MENSKEKKVFIAGHLGLVGRAVHRAFKDKSYKNFCLRTRQELDLTNQHAVEAFYADEKPDLVVVCAAKVGGIAANNQYRSQFIYENLQIQNNVIWQAHKAGVEHLIFLGALKNSSWLSFTSN